MVTINIGFEKKCRHKRKIRMETKHVGYTSAPDGIGGQMKKYKILNFCPDCNRNVTEHKIG